MTEDKDRRMKRFAKGHARKLAPLINTLEQRLIQETIEGGSPINAKEIKAICSTMSREFNVLSRFIYQILKLYEGWDGKGDFRHQRKDILGRLLVHQFEELIEGVHPKGVHGGALPRFAISGILRAFRGLVGSEILMSFAMKSIPLTPASATQRRAARVKSSGLSSTKTRTPSSPSYASWEGSRSALRNTKSARNG